MSHFFLYFPKIFYQNKLLTDITNRIKIRETWLNDVNLYYIYDYQDHDKPEHIAQKYYGNEMLHWIILLTNQVFDPFFDFPMNYDTFRRFIEGKYKDKYGVKTLKIESNGTDYVSGIYKEVPLTIKNSDELEKLGEDILVDIIVTSGEVSNIDVFRGGTGYSANTIFEVDNSYLGGTGSGFECSVIDFMSALEYSQTTPDPVYRYQKKVRTTNSDGSTERYYVVDREGYLGLYENGNPSATTTIDMDGESVIYEITRRYPEITLYERELEVNESKRKIKILKKEYVKQAVSDLLRLMRKQQNG